MPLFVIQCTDRPGSLQLRLDTRPAHLDYMNGLGDRLVVGGPFLGPDGQPNGSMIVADFADQAAADAFRSEEHTSELQSLMRTSYAVFCLKKKNLTYIYQY